ncbi:MAG: high frequency lysogenization protein HflD [Hahellaceae bacterium]|nr:high frequency lysogenization protein HflD [Hahellaceae bacterium]
MAYSFEDQVMALAGVFQSVLIVDQIAKQGTVPETAYECSLQSLLRNDVQNVAEVYGGRHGLQLGLKLVCSILDKKQDRRQMDPVRYALTLLYLEGKLRRRHDLNEVIRQRLGQIEKQAAHFDLLHPTVIKAFAGLYTDTLSTLPQRIQVTGEPRHLQVQENADRIRAVLLAGIRSAVLWHQTGGRRWKLIFYRKQTLEAARHLLS